MLTKANMQTVAEMTVCHTHRLYSEHLLYSKDIPTFDIPNSKALRTLDPRSEKWLRFEVSLIKANGEKIENPTSLDALDMGQNDVLFLVLFDAADPAGVYMCKISHDSFLSIADE
jgi:hypothetical protein